MKNSKALLWLLGSLFVFSAAACDQGGVGDPCIPEDEYRADFPGYGIQEVNIESRSFQCETRICLVNHFRGRVTCPYGQQDAACVGDAPPDSCGDPKAEEAVHSQRCTLPNQDAVVEGAVLPQYRQRQAEDAVYCSCRCDGPDSNARYCECPSGYSCLPLVDDLGLGRGQLAGSYCVKSGTKYEEQTFTSCRDFSIEECGPFDGPLADD